MKEPLIKNGYPDVDVKIIGDVPWRVGKLAGELPEAQSRALDLMQIPAHQAQGNRDTDKWLLARVPVWRLQPARSQT